MTLTVVYECPDGTPFPVEWPDGEMSRDSWSWDQVKNPLPLTPLAQDFMNTKREGMARAARHTGRPADSERIFVNGYAFARPVEPSAGEAERYSAIAERDAESRIDRLLELWETTYLPEVEALTSSLGEWAGPGEPLSDLTGRWDDVESISQRLGELHTLSTGLINRAMRQFEDFCRAEFGADGERIARKAVAGMPNMSIKSAEALWELSRRALGRPAVAALIRSSAPERFVAQLEGVDQGGEFRKLLDEFLHEYGHRNESFFEISFPTWREDPRFVVSAVRSFIDLPEDRSPSVMHQRVAERRELVTEEAVRRIGSETRTAAFFADRRRAQQHTVLMEDHNYYIDQRGHSALRAPCLAVAERLVTEGAIARVDDVFYLHGSEIREAAGRPGAGWKALAASRRANRDAWRGVLPPSKIGGEPDRGKDVPDTGAEAGVVRGVAASAGVVAGRARVVLTLDEIERLAPGEVLVTYATAPSWTPVFAYAAAVVTDAGGPLSHCAVVAREYGIPAVVGASGATSRIRDGMVIAVDGSAGVVRLIG